MISSFLFSTVPLVCIFPKCKRFLFCSNYYPYNRISFNVWIYYVFRFYSTLWALTQLFNFCFSLCLLPPGPYYTYCIIFPIIPLWISRNLFYLSSLNDTTFPSSKKMRKSKYYIFLHHISFLYCWSLGIFLYLVYNQKPRIYFNLSPRTFSSTSARVFLLLPTPELCSAIYSSGSFTRTLWLITKRSIFCILD